MCLCSLCTAALIKKQNLDIRSRSHTAFLIKAWQHSHKLGDKLYNVQNTQLIRWTHLYYVRFFVIQLLMICLCLIINKRAHARELTCTWIIYGSLTVSCSWVKTWKSFELCLEIIAIGLEMNMGKTTIFNPDCEHLETVEQRIESVNMSSAALPTTKVQKRLAELNWAGLRSENSGCSRQTNYNYMSALRNERSKVSVSVTGFLQQK